MECLDMSERVYQLEFIQVRPERFWAEGPKSVG